MGDPASSYAATSTALRIMWPHKLHRYVKVETPSGAWSNMIHLKLWKGQHHWLRFKSLHGSTNFNISIILNGTFLNILMCYCSKYTFCK
jgi:hypothetical protein